VHLRRVLRQGLDRPAADVRVGVLGGTTHQIMRVVIVRPVGDQQVETGPADKGFLVG
jgi:hypothetical protein